MDVKTGAACVIPGKLPSKVIDGVRFVHTLEEGAAMSHYMETNLYRGFKNRCYELAIHVTFSNFGVYDPGTIKEFTKRDKERVTQDLERILDSFKILRPN